MTCGITPAHLLLSDNAMGDFRTFARLSPPLRDESDRQAALAAVADGTIDVLCSGHDPRGPEDKRLPFADAAPGASGAETLLALGLSLELPIERLFTLLAANPAKVLGLDTGTLAPGMPADLVLLDAVRPVADQGRRHDGKSRQHAVRRVAGSRKGAPPVERRHGDFGLAYFFVQAAAWSPAPARTKQRPPLAR